MIKHCCHLIKHSWHLNYTLWKIKHTFVLWSIHAKNFNCKIIKALDTLPQCPIKHLVLPMLYFMHSTRSYALTVMYICVYIYVYIIWKMVQIWFLASPQLATMTSCLNLCSWLYMLLKFVPHRRKLATMLYILYVYIQVVTILMAYEYTCILYNHTYMYTQPLVVCWLDWSKVLKFCLGWLSAWEICVIWALSLPKVRCTYIHICV